MGFISKFRGKPSRADATAPGPAVEAADRELQLIKTFTPDEYRRGLESWAWLATRDKNPICTSLFGDVFLEGEDGVWFLDTLEGSLNRPWSRRSEMEGELASEAGQDRYLMAGLALALHRQGMQLTPPQVYDFTVPPVLGGSLSAENVATMDFVVALNLAGQLHEQVKDLPPGTKISEFKITEPGESER